MENKLPIKIDTIPTSKEPEPIETWEARQRKWLEKQYPAFATQAESDPLDLLVKKIAAANRQ